MGKKVLFADDDPLVARIYREKLAEAGFDVMVAEDGVAATKKAVEFKPDLVVLDLLMPKLTGADVLKFIRQHPDLRSTRVVVLSNSFLAALVEQVATDGVEEALPKTATTPARLIDVIHKVLAGPIHNGAASSEPIPVAAAVVQSSPPATAHARPLVIKVEKPAIAETRAKKDEQFRSRVQSEFATHAPAVVAGMRQMCRELLEASDPAIELHHVEDLSRKVGFLTHMATMAGFNELAQVASALELLLFHLQEKSRPLEDSCRNTIATTVAFLADRLDAFDSLADKKLPPAAVLLVDDDAVSNRGFVHALTHAGLRAVSVNDPVEALGMLRQTPQDLVLLDIDMPGLDGITLVEQMRALPKHKHTPVIFLTHYSDLKTRARAVLHGADEFISKPILPIELTVKVITAVMKGRLGHASAKA